MNVNESGVIDPIVAPGETDPLLIPATERLGGPLGARASAVRRFWNPLRILIVLTSAGFTIGYISKLPCHAESFGGDARYTRLCYSDIPFLYQLRGFADGWLPYIDTGHGQTLEYPVLTGAFMQLASMLTGHDGPASARALVFFDWNVLLLLICLIIAVVCTALTVRRRPWDAAMVALAPATILSAVINWDLLAVAFTAASMLAWSRKRVGWSGVLLGLAIASKFYPLFILGPLFLLCLRSGQLRSFWKLLATTAAAWLAVNVPIMMLNFDGWKEFYVFSATRGADWGSIWYVLMAVKHPVPPESLNAVVAVLLVTLCVGIALIILRAQRRPRYAQVAFLVIAAFCLTNKVYSPQYVLWLIPLAAMARPRWRDFLIWQTGQVIYFASVWYFLQQYGNDNKGLPEGWYVAAVLVQIASTCWLAGMVIRDIVSPLTDPVRTDGYDDDLDDPGGGVLDFAPDVFTFRGRESVAQDVSKTDVPVGLSD